MDADRRRIPDRGEVFPREHVNLSLVDPAEGGVHVEGRDIDHLHDRVDHLGDRRVIHLPPDLVHAPLRPVEGDCLGEFQDGKLVLRRELHVRPEDVVCSGKPEPLEAAAVVPGDLPDLFHGSLAVQERVEVGDEHGHLEPCFLQVHQFVHRHHVAEVDLSARLVAGVDPLDRAVDERTQFLVGDDFYRVSRHQFVWIH